MSRGQRMFTLLGVAAAMLVFAAASARGQDQSVRATARSACGSTRNLR